ncbi:MAG: hypothetical protein WC389_05165 [Lutibacter sp.]|jgi:hypothetical protein
MKKEINHTHLASSVIWWLNYISAVGRDYIINESSIKYPVAEYLEKSICEKDKIKLEFNHPFLYKRSLDLFYEKDGTKTAFEFKYIKNGSTTKPSEKQRVFNDLLRLHYFLENGGDKAYFLICGKKDEFKHSFMEIPIPDDKSKPISTKTFSKFYQHWLDFEDDKTEKEIDIKNPHSDYEGNCDKFYKFYKPKKGKVLNKVDCIKTKLVFLSQELVDSKIPENLRIGIWEIVI